jgi:hypothetical protein
MNAEKISSDEQLAVLRQRRAGTLMEKQDAASRSSAAH